MSDEPTNGLHLPNLTIRLCVLADDDRSVLVQDHIRLAGIPRGAHGYAVPDGRRWNGSWTATT